MTRSIARAVVLVMLGCQCFISGCHSDGGGRDHYGPGNVGQLLQYKIANPGRIVGFYPPGNDKLISIPEILLRLQDDIQSNTTYELAIYVDPWVARLTMTNDNPLTLGTLVLPVSDMPVEDFVTVLCRIMDAEWVACDKYIVIGKKKDDRSKLHAAPKRHVNTYR